MYIMYINLKDISSYTTASIPVFSNKNTWHHSGCPRFIHPKLPSPETTPPRQDRLSDETALEESLECGDLHHFVCNQSISVTKRW